MNHLGEIQSWLRSTSLAGLVIPSTDEFISEFPPPCNRRLQWATGFRGSTGMAIVLRDKAALFLDGRYQQQGIADTGGTSITVEPATFAARRSWLKRTLVPPSCLGLDPKIHSITEMIPWQSLAAELGFELELLPANPIDTLWLATRPATHSPPIVDYPVCHAGDTYQTKCAALVKHVEATGLQALLVADPEDVSWLLNVRAAGEAVNTAVGEWHVVPTCTSRALVRSDGVTWFVDDDRLTSEVAKRHGQGVTISPPGTLAATLHANAQQGPIGVDPRRTPAAIAMAIEDQRQIRPDDTVARRRWRKHAAELQSARQAHLIDAVAIVRFMAWLTRTIGERVISEFEAAEVLEALRAEHPAYKGASMPLMSASGPSGSMPHYVPRRQESRKLNEHPIYWMDSGGHYPGGTTDNTLTLALGIPEPKHVLAHTLVLQGFIALATARIPVGTYALHLDVIARQPLWREGMDFAHNTGHGVGNNLNIHEGPLIGREPGPTSTVALEPGMILTNEPGYYLPGDFGLRIESHMVVIASGHPRFLEFETISRLPIDPRLVDFGRLSLPERRWLADYHRAVFKDVGPLLDPASAAWLRAVMETFVSAE